MPDLVARKSITTIQDGSKYRERYLLPDTQPEGTTVQQLFFDSAGGTVAEIVGEVDGRVITFDLPYADVEAVPNGAGFYCYIQRPDEDPGDLIMVRYGSTFRRQLTFPHSPASVISTVVHEFEDTFQRPAGAVGGRWKVLVGRPRIFDNVEWFGLGEDHPNTVGTNIDWFTSFFMYYYQPFNADAVELSISATRKGNGMTIITLCQNAAGTSYLYVGFNAFTQEAELGFGTSPNIGAWLTPTGALEPQIEPVPVTIPGDDGIATFKIRFDDITKTLSLYNEDMTTLICSWTDEDDLVPHGRGYRYFGMGGNSGVLDSGIQLAYIRAHGIV